MRHGISRLRDLDMPTGESKREPRRYEHPAPGEILHVDVKKVGRIPDGGGWAIHGRGTDEAPRDGSRTTGLGTSTSMRLSMTTAAWPTPKSTPTSEPPPLRGSGFRSVLFYREHGVTTIKCCLTDNGPAYRSKVLNDSLTHTGTAHKFTRPDTPRTNGKVERFNLTMKIEWLYVRPYASDEERTAALADFLNTYNHERPHSALGNKPPPVGCRSRRTALHRSRGTSLRPG